MSRHSKRIALQVALAILPAMAGLQAQETAPSAAKKVVLVELFTSEGCSSCPPADELLRSVNGTQTSAGQWIVGISEHVTYWNALGWSDPFSSPANTQRQNEYGQHFHLDGVYTPQMVINGAEEIVGSDRGAFLRAVKKEAELPAQMSLQILSVNVAGDSATLHYSAGGEVPAHGADLVAVIADDSDLSSVLRGENSGQTLTHVSVARSITRVAKLQATGERTIEIKLPSGFKTSQKHHLILFAQTPGNGRVLGADTKPL